VDQEKVVALIGCLYSTQVLATSDAIKNYGIPTIIGATNVNITRQGNPWLFRVRPDDSIAAGAMVKYIKEDTKLTKIGLLHDADAMGTGGADLVEKGAKEAGLTVVKRAKTATGAKDFTAELLAMKSAGPGLLRPRGSHGVAPAPDSPAWLTLQVSRFTQRRIERQPEPCQGGCRRDLGRGRFRAGTERGEQALRRGIQEGVQRRVRHPRGVDI
jgi:hypothetical protein